MKLNNAPTYIILTLIVIGVISLIFTNPKDLIVPIAVFGIIYLLYKFPPQFASNRANTYKSVNKRRKSKSRAKLHVIDGKKSIMEIDDDEKPKYH